MVTALKPITNSSQVKAAGYDAVSQTLSVIYHGTPKRYDYKAVPSDVAMAFDAAESKGSFLAKNVKGKFEFDPVDIDADTQAEA